MGQKVSKITIPPVNQDTLPVNISDIVKYIKCANGVYKMTATNPLNGRERSKVISPVKSLMVGDKKVYLYNGIMLDEAGQFVFINPLNNSVISLSNLVNDPSCSGTGVTTRPNTPAVSPAPIREGLVERFDTGSVIGLSIVVIIIILCVGIAYYKDWKDNKDLKQILKTS